MTRAGPGIGRAVASALLSNGYQVALAGRRADKLKLIIEETGPGERALVVATDLADPGAVAALFAATVKRYGRLDLLFNNAGTAAHSAPMERAEVAQQSSP